MGKSPCRSRCPHSLLRGTHLHLHDSSSLLSDPGAGAFTLGSHSYWTYSLFSFCPLSPLAWPLPVSHFLLFRQIPLSAISDTITLPLAPTFTSQSLSFLPSQIVSLLHEELPLAISSGWGWCNSLVAKSYYFMVLNPHIFFKLLLKNCINEFYKFTLVLKIATILYLPFLFWGFHCLFC